MIVISFKLIGFYIRYNQSKFPIRPLWPYFEYLEGKSIILILFIMCFSYPAQSSSIKCNLTICCIYDRKENVVILRRWEKLEKKISDCQNNRRFTLRCLSQNTTLQVLSLRVVQEHPGELKLLQKLRNNWRTKEWGPSTVPLTFALSRGLHLWITLKMVWMVNYTRNAAISSREWGNWGTLRSWTDKGINLIDCSRNERWPLKQQRWPPKEQ